MVPDGSTGTRLGIHRGRKYPDEKLVAWSRSLTASTPWWDSAWLGDALVAGSIGIRHSDLLEIAALIEEIATQLDAVPSQRREGCDGRTVRCLLHHEAMRGGGLSVFHGVRLATEPPSMTSGSSTPAAHRLLT